MVRTVIVQVFFVLLLIILIALVIIHIALTFGWRGIIPCSLAMGASILTVPRILKTRFYEVKEGTVAVIERGGAFHRIAEPGPIILGPFDNVHAEVPMYEVIFECDPQHVLTGSAIPIDVEVVVSYQIKNDPEAIRRAVYAIYDWRKATERQAIAALHTAVGEYQLLVNENFSLGNMQLFVNNRMREILEKRTERWGVSINQVYLRNIKLDDSFTKLLRGRNAGKRQSIAEKESIGSGQLGQADSSSQESPEVARRLRDMLETM